MSDTDQVEELVVILVLPVREQGAVVTSLILPFPMEIICHYVDEVKLSTKNKKALHVGLFHFLLKS